MGWWKIGNQNERLMSDETADDIVYCLRNIVNIYEKEQQVLPTFKDYMSKIGTAILSGDCPVEDESARQAVTDFLNLLQNNQIIVQLLPEAEEILYETLRRITHAYKASLDRYPFVMEIIANFLFGLADAPENYISDQAGLIEVRKKILSADTHPGSLE